MTLNSYLTHVYDAWEEYDSDKISDLLSLDDVHCQNRICRNMTDDEIDFEVNELLTSPISELIGFHLKVLEYIFDRNWDQALTIQCQLGNAYCKVLSAQKDDNWGLNIMEVICQDLRRVALSARRLEDPLIRSEEHAPTCMEKAADVIMSLFRVCAADTRTQENETKRWGMLPLVNHLFKIYFRINRLHLCKPLIRAIDAQPIKDKFPVNQMVTYKYYVGRKAMFDSEFKTAESCFTYAFLNCSPLSVSENKKKILTYLVPVKMFLGWLPNKEALEKYGLENFFEVAEAFKQGNIKRFNDAMEKSEQAFIKGGVYLVLEKLKMMLYRNLFKKVSLIYGNHQVPIHVLEAALRWSGYEDIDLDETHCLLANLIYDGQIRGYISHQHQVLVIAKQNAFPKISSLEIN